MTKNEVIELINNTIEALTWNRLAMVITICVFALLMVSAFDNREKIIDELTTKSRESVAESWELSESSRKEVEALVNSQALITAAFIWDVDLRKNRASSIFIYPKDLSSGVAPELTLPHAFFDSEPKSRSQIISVINNNFTCAPTEDVTFAKSLAKKFSVICLLAIPPYAGGFAGFVGFGLERQPSNVEKDALRIELTRMSISIYLRDAENRTQKKN